MDTNGAKKLSLIIMVGMLAEYIAIEGLYGQNPFVIFRNDFPNVVVTISMLAAGAWVTLAVVEQALKEDKRKLWTKARKITYWEIVNYVSFIVAFAPLSNPGLTDLERVQIEESKQVISKKLKEYKIEVANEMAKILNLLDEARPRRNRELIGISKEQTLGEAEQILLYYSYTQTMLNTFHTILIPRVLAFSESEKLIEALMHFESASLDYESDMRDQEAHKSEYALHQESLIYLLQAATNVYLYIAEDVMANNSSQID